MKNNNDISESIKMEFGIKNVELSDFPTELQTQIQFVLRKFNQIYPEVISRIDRISSIQTYNKHLYDLGYGIRRESKDTFARSYKSTSNGKICFNRFWLKNFDDFIRRLQRSEESGYFAKYTGTPIGIFIHEFGHQLYNFLRYKGFVSNIDEYYDSIFPMNQISKELSRYATENETEFFAEAFAEYYCSPEPSVISITVVTMADSILRQYRKTKMESFCNVTTN